ncbi:formyl transferase [Niveispirillum sp.]|uniref:glucosamine inositolphosphorylceramide transferase family protein n=1 Tax=Niveispirillum sp. TaxID=1917217 RepID=UPI001B5067FB|nr:formyl transferase [Niveispirillum sp.]MBP7337719.1 formyl transferase [Niveispirillum sp.]
MPRRKDIWRCGLIARPLEAVMAEGMAGAKVHWLPEEPRFRFLADPFAWRGADHLHLFAEVYDYATRHGTIELLTLDERFQVRERRPCLAEPWHLSYPVVFEADGAVWMLPEAHRSGALYLYRMSAGPHDWVRETEIRLDCVPVDATPLYHGGRWWLFYSPADSKATKVGHLHVAWAERITGPWFPHPGNPVRIDRSSARPGGTALAIGNRILLPTQDCTRTYGGAIRPLWIDRLDETGFAATPAPPLDMPASVGHYRDGMHTLSGGGGVTLIDVKYIDRSMAGLWLDINRRWGRSGA